MQSIFFALISYVGFATGDILGVFAARKMGSYRATLWGLVFGLMLSSLYIPFAWGDLRRITVLAVLGNFALGIVLIIGLVAFNEGLRMSNPAMVGSIASGFPVVILVLSLIFFDERPGRYQFVCILTILIGLFLTIVNPRDIRLEKQFGFALIAMLAWGIYFTFVKVFVLQFGWFWPNYISMASFPILILFGRRGNTPLYKVPGIKDGLGYLIPEVILVRTAEFSYNIGISKGLSSVIGPVAGSYATLYVLLSYWIFREPMRRSQAIGVLLSLAGVIGLALQD